MKENDSISFFFNPEEEALEFNLSKTNFLEDKSDFEILYGLKEVSIDTKLKESFSSLEEMNNPHNITSLSEKDKILNEEEIEENLKIENVEKILTFDNNEMNIENEDELNVTVKIYDQVENKEENISTKGSCNEDNNNNNINNISNSNNEKINNNNNNKLINKQAIFVIKKVKKKKIKISIIKKNKNKINLNKINILKRKNDPDSIRRKIKPYFHKYLLETLNSKIKKKFFYKKKLKKFLKFNNKLTSTVSIKLNKKLIDRKIYQILLKEPISSKYKSYDIENNKKLVMYLLSLKDREIDKILKSSYSEIYSQYLNSPNYQFLLKKIKIKDGENYMRKFYEISQNFICYFLFKHPKIVKNKNWKIKNKNSNSRTKNKNNNNEDDNYNEFNNNNNDNETNTNSHCNEEYLDEDLQYQNEINLNYSNNNFELINCNLEKKLKFDNLFDDKIFVKSFCKNSNL